MIFKVGDYVHSQAFGSDIVWLIFQRPRASGGVFRLRLAYVMPGATIDDYWTRGTYLRAYPSALTHTNEMLVLVLAACTTET